MRNWRIAMPLSTVESAPPPALVKSLTQTLPSFFSWPFPVLLLSGANTGLLTILLLSGANTWSFTVHPHSSWLSYYSPDIIRCYNSHRASDSAETSVKKVKKKKTTESSDAKKVDGEKAPGSAETKKKKKVKSRSVVLFVLSHMSSCVSSYSKHKSSISPWVSHHMHWFNYAVISPTSSHCCLVSIDTDTDIDIDIDPEIAIAINTDVAIGVAIDAILSFSDKSKPSSKPSKKKVKTQSGWVVVWLPHTIRTHTSTAYACYMCDCSELPKASQVPSQPDDVDMAPAAARSKRDSPSRSDHSREAKEPSPRFVPRYPSASVSICPCLRWDLCAPVSVCPSLRLPQSPSAPVCVHPCC